MLPRSFGAFGSVARLFFFFNDTATTEIYTLSLHDALPIFLQQKFNSTSSVNIDSEMSSLIQLQKDRKSTRLNSSHPSISYDVFCLQKKRIEPADSQTAHRQRVKVARLLATRVG